MRQEVDSDDRNDRQCGPHVQGQDRPWADRPDAAAGDPGEPAGEGGGRQQRQQRAQRESAPATATNGRTDASPELLGGGHQQRAADEPVQPEEGSGRRNPGPQREQPARQLQEEQGGQQPVERGAAHRRTVRRQARGNAANRA